MLRLISFDLINVVLHVTKISVHMFSRVLLSILLRVIHSHSRSWFKIIIYPLSSESLLFYIMLSINFRQQSTIEDMCSYATGKTQVHSFQLTRNTADGKKPHNICFWKPQMRQDCLGRPTTKLVWASLAQRDRPARARGAWARGSGRWRRSSSCQGGGGGEQCEQGARLWGSK